MCEWHWLNWHARCLERKWQHSIRLEALTREFNLYASLWTFKLLCPVKVSAGILLACHYCCSTCSGVVVSRRTPVCRRHFRGRAKVTVFIKKNGFSKGRGSKSERGSYGDPKVLGNAKIRSESPESVAFQVFNARRCDFRRPRNNPGDGGAKISKQVRFWACCRPRSTRRTSIDGYPQKTSSIVRGAGRRLAPDGGSTFMSWHGQCMACL